jgi:hypothetical protein
MSKINKTNSGLLFFDDFSEKTLMWTQSPSDIDCLSFGDNGLQIQHNNSYITYTIIEPDLEEYSCVVHLDHIPFDESDIAGVIVMSTAKDYAECQSYMAHEPSEIFNRDIPTTDEINIMINNILNDKMDNYVEYTINGEAGTIATVSEGDEATVISTKTENFVDKLYKYIKFTKEKLKYRFLASTDGLEWIEVGNTTFVDAGVIGFFLHSTEAQEIVDNSHCYFHTFAIYNSKYVVIDGIEDNHEFEIYDDSGYIHMRSDDTMYAKSLSRSNKKCVINTTTMPTPIKNAQLRIFPHGKYKSTISNFSLGEDIYGGDMFTVERDIKLYINNQEIDPFELYDLGTFYRGSYFVKLDLYNNENYILNDVKVKVIKYSEYYGGEEEVAVALHDEDHVESELVYNKEVIIDSIAPSEGRSVYIKLIDRPIQDFYMTANSYRFKIIIE